MVGLVPKHHECSSIWALKPYYFGPWTLRGRCGLGSRAALDSDFLVWAFEFALVHYMLAAL